MEALKKKELITVYAIGSIAYRFIEILWRGYTHWTMGVLGGICFFVIYITEHKMSHCSLIKKALISSCFITAAELTAGIIINKLLGLDVWDYSNMKFNLAGQISLLYSVFWFFLCIPSHILCKILKHRVFDALPESNRRKQKFLKGSRIFGKKENELSE